MRAKFLGKDTVRLTLRKKTWLPLSINLSRHPKLQGRCWSPYHGVAADPAKWSWWKLFHFSLINLTSVCKPSTGYRLWVYGRDDAKHYDIFFDRRDLN